MSHLAKVIVTFCILAGLVVAMSHQALHGDHDECAAQHSCGADHSAPSPGESHHQNGHDGHDDHDHPSGSTHHHECCQILNIDRNIPITFSAVSFVTRRLEVTRHHSLMPESPVFSLDKPPLI